MAVFDPYLYPAFDGVAADAGGRVPASPRPEAVVVVGAGGRQGGSMSADKIEVARVAVEDAVSDLPLYARPAAAAFLRVLEGAQSQRASTVSRSVEQRRVPPRRRVPSRSRADLRLVSR